MNNKKLMLTKIYINGMGWCTFLVMFSYMIPIAMTFELNVYDMRSLTVLFAISMTCLLLFFSSINKILKKYNKMELECTHNELNDLIDEMIYIYHIFAYNSIIEILILFATAVVITYALWWWKADIWPVAAVFYYIVLVTYTTLNLFTVKKYIKNFTFFKKRLYDEVYKK